MPWWGPMTSSTGMDQPEPRAHRYLSWSNRYTDLRISKNLNMHSRSPSTAYFLKCCWISFLRGFGLLELMTLLGRNLWSPTWGT